MVTLTGWTINVPTPATTPNTPPSFTPQDVIQPTTGDTVMARAVADLITLNSPDLDVKPYMLLPGSGFMSVLNRTASSLLDQLTEGIFPSFDAVAVDAKGKTFKNYGGNPTLDEFQSWPSQVQWLHVVKLGNNPKVAGYDVVATSDDTFRAFIVKDLIERDLVTMSTADQKKVAATADFATYVAPRTGLTTVLADAVAEVVKVSDGIKALSATTNTPRFNADDQHFLNQLSILKTQIEAGAVFDVTEIKKAAGEIEERFKRAFQFRLEVIASNGGSGPVPALDNGASMQAAYDTFIRQEAKIAAATKAKDDLTKASAIGGKTLDAPTLVFLFQFYTQGIKTAKIEAATEEANQINELLQAYSEMQKIVKGTLAVAPGATPKPGDNLKVAFPFTASTVPPLLRMFDDEALTAGKPPVRRPHPLESIYGISRPSLNMIEGAGSATTYNQSRSAWEIFGQQLSESVTSLNQRSQILMNDINAMEKEKNRHFEQANTALSKAAEIIANILRST